MNWLGEPIMAAQGLWTLSAETGALTSTTFTFRSFRKIELQYSSLNLGIFQPSNRLSDLQLTKKVNK